MSNESVILQCIQLAQQNPTIEILWLYGSHAKGTAQADSDYDLAVAFSFENTLDHSYHLDDLASQWRQKTEQDLSMIDINQIPTPLAYNVIQDGLVLVCKNPLRLHTEQARIWSLWEGFKYEHQKNRA